MKIEQYDLDRIPMELKAARLIHGTGRIVIPALCRKYRGDDD